MRRWPPLLLLVALAACAGNAPAPAEPTTAPPTPTGNAPQPKDEAPPKLAENDNNDDELPDGDVVTEPGQTEPPPARKPAEHPLAKLSNAQLAKLLDTNPKALGSASLGATRSGALFNGVQMPKATQYKVVNPTQTWGTRETVDNLIKIIRTVNKQFPKTLPLRIGDISEHKGGYIPPHVSHQSGRDVDLGFYYTKINRWYTRAHDGNLDVARTWALVRAAVTETDVEVIFLDRAVQKLLRKHAESKGEDSKWLDKIFGGPTTTLRPLIRHAKGHRTHLHIRFYNPIAQETGRRIYRLLLKNKLIRRPTYYIKYKVRRKDTLIRLAHRFKTTVRAIKRANRLRSSRIITNRKYRIPRRGGVRQSNKPVVIPERRLPPPAR